MAITPVPGTCPCGGGTLEVLDTESVDLTLAADVLSADVIIDPAAGNQLSVGVDGLFVPEGAGTTVSDTTSVDLTLAAGDISAAVIVSGTAGNQLTSTASGLYVPAGAAAALGTVTLTPEDAIVPDGSASNLAPEFIRTKSSAAAPSPYFYQLNFDAGLDEFVTFQFTMPRDYVSGPILRVAFKMASAVAGNVVLDARVSAITPGDAVDMDAKAFAAANTVTQAVPATAGFVVNASITLTNADSVAAGDEVLLYLSRTGTSGSDTAAGDLEFVGAYVEYTRP